MNKLWRLGIVCLMLVGLVGVFATQKAASIPPNELELACKSLIGDWKNQLTPPSTLSIKKIDYTTGKIDGTYTSPSGTSSEVFDLCGWVNFLPREVGKKENVVVLSYTVRWGDYGSITSWNGIYRAQDTPPRIQTQWLLSRPNANFQWEHTLAGNDSYTK